MSFEALLERMAGTRHGVESDGVRYVPHMVVRRLNHLPLLFENVM